MSRFLGLVGCVYPENIQLTINSVGSLRDYIVNDLGTAKNDLKVLQDT